MRMKAPLAAVLSILIAVLVASSGVAQSAHTFFLTDVDASGFPDVTFRMRAVDIRNKPVEGLNAENITVYENGEQVSNLEVVPHDDGPITYIFVIDMGRLSLGNYLTFTIPQILSPLVSGGYFQDGVDTVTILARENFTTDQTRTLLDQTQSSTEFSTRVSGINPPRTGGTTKGLLGVEDALEQIPSLVGVPGSQTTAVIYITRLVEDPSRSIAPASAQNTAELAQSLNTSIYVLHTDFNGSYNEPLRVLTEGTDGEYALLRRNAVESSVASIYQAIATQRGYFQVSYRSPLANPDNREVTVNAPTRPERGTVATYQIEVRPPAVTINEPVANSNLRREESIAEGDDVATFDLTEVRVAAQVSWPDEHPRSIETAELIVNGVVQDTIAAAPDQSQFDFTWDLSLFNTEGIQPVTLSVRVVDELGLEAQTDHSIALEVVPLQEQSAPLSMSTLAAIGLPALCLIGLGLAAVIGGTVYLIRKGSGSAAEAGAGGKGVVQPTMFSAEAHDLVLATLTVLEGPSGMIGEILRITGLKTTLGRDPAQSDISFYAEQQSSVSRTHCEIVLEDDNAFRLLDKNSSAGTWLNGRKIHPDVPVVIEDQDEIVMGDLAQRGVKLEFNFARPDEHRPYSGTADDRTHVLPDQDPADWSGPNGE